MTIEQAKTIATDAAYKWNKSFVVWRMPAWPIAVYGVLEEERGLPKLAIVAHTATAPKTGMLF